MNTVVYKYAIEGNSGGVVKLPQGAQILTVQAQGNKPTIWALVDPKAPLVARSFEIVYTGEILNGVATRQYLATVHISGLVLHIFERL